MKRRTGTLKLHRETLKALDTQVLEPAIGGLLTSPRVCTFSGYRTCGTCVLTCGTNLC